MPKLFPTGPKEMHLHLYTRDGKVTDFSSGFRLALSYASSVATCLYETRSTRNLAVSSGAALQARSRIQPKRRGSEGTRRVKPSSPPEVAHVAPSNLNIEVIYVWKIMYSTSSDYLMN